MKDLASPSSLRAVATAADAALYAAQLKGQYPAELVKASADAWRAYRSAVYADLGYVPGPSEGQALGFTSL